jgi:alpha-galactosidase
MKNNSLKSLRFQIVVSMLFCSSLGTWAQVKISKAPMGWNSFDSYGVYLHHDAAIRNIDEMAQRYLKFGYNYYVIDAGWYGEYKLKPGTIYPAEFQAQIISLDEYGVPQPSKTYFPQGLKVLADRAHAKGLKFGVHIMRGISRQAYRLNTKVKGTPYFAKDITDTTSICTWNNQFYGVDMSKPGAQAFYNSLLNQLAEWGVDFIKADDIVPFPKEVEGVANAIAQCGRPIVLSLSPGGSVDPNALSSFRRANMLRVTHDIWDEQIGIDQCFEAWRKWQGKETEHFYIDMDMIPFGELQIMSPKPDELSGSETKDQIRKLKKEGKLSNIELLAGKGWHRQSAFSKDQMLTFITMRALAASPLIIGGDLKSMDDFAYALITNTEMIKCNQNGVVGSLVSDKNSVEIWKSISKTNNKEGWVGLFNRNKVDATTLKLTPELLGFDKNSKLALSDVWDKKNLNINQSISIRPNSVLFVKLKQK